MERAVDVWAVGGQIARYEKRKSSIRDEAVFWLEGPKRNLVSQSVLSDVAVADGAIPPVKGCRY